MPPKKKLSKLEFLQDRQHLKVGAKPDSPWQTDDRNWFARNSSRGYRLRPTFEGEWPTDSPYMLLRRVRDGVRVKQGISVGNVSAAQMALLFGTSALADSALAKLWVAVQMGEPVLVDELLAQARAPYSTMRH